MASNRLDIAAIDEAYVDHMKTLFGAVVRHLQAPDGADSARREFRKGLAIARQAKSEMEAIADE